MPTEYIVQDNDSLWKIAKENGLTLQELIALNPQYKANPGLIKPGEKIALQETTTIPGAGDNKDTTEIVPPEEKVPFDPNMYNFEFRGANLAIIDYTDDGSDDLWVFDKANKIYRPYESIEAVAKYYSLDPKTVADNINNLETTVRDAYPDQFGGTWLNAEYRVNNNGAAFKEPQIKSNVTGLKGMYGATKKDVEAEQHAAKLINTALTKSKNNGAISQATFDETLKEQESLAKYTNAIAYGGYSLPDVFRDIKAVELSNQGNAIYDDIKGIHETTPASQWTGTDDGRRVKNDSNLLVPSELMGWDTELFDNPVFQIPDGAYKTLVKPIDWTSPEFQEEAENIQAAWYDIMMQQAEATTEQDKALADSSWNDFKTSLEKQYDLRLSSDARQAWGQVQEITGSHGQRGLGNSGIMNGVIDAQLADTRRSNDILRDAKLTEEETNHRNYLLNAGTQDEIATFISENPEKAKDWGFTPSDEVKNSLSLESLKAQYPEMDDKEIQLVHDMTLDRNGNYRSKLHKNLYSNKYNLQSEKKDYQIGTVTYDSEGNITGGHGLMLQRAQEAQKAGQLYDEGSGVSSYTPEGTSPEYADNGENGTPETPENIRYQDAPGSVKGSTINNGTSPTGDKPIVNNTNLGTSNYQTYTARTGDTSSRIASKYGFSLDEWKNANKDTIKDVNYIYAGKTYNLPNTQKSKKQDYNAASEAAGNINKMVTPTGSANASPKSTYSGGSIYDYMSSIGKDPSYNARIGIAKEQGIQNYTGSPQQNKDLLKKLRGY